MKSDANLICTVREYPELYDPKHPLYYDIGHRDKLWEQIAITFQDQSVTVKKKWSHLRDCYRKFLRKRRNGELVRHPGRPWKYEKEMSFLQGYVWFSKRRPADDQSQALDREPSPLEKVLADDPDKSMPDTSELSDVDNDREANDEDHDPFEETETFFVKMEPIEFQKRQGEQSESTPAKRQKTLNTAASSSTATETRDSDCCGEAEIPAPDTLSVYFNYVEETVRTFPSLLQIEFKMKMSQVLSEFEMKNLMSEQ